MKSDFEHRIILAKKRGSVRRPPEIYGFAIRRFLQVTFEGQVKEI